MEARRGSSLRWRNVGYALAVCCAVSSQRVHAQGGFAVVAKSGDLAPGINEGFDVLGASLINDSGQVAFYGSTASFQPQSPGPSGVFVGTPGDVRLVAKVGDPAPGLGAGVSLISISPVAFSNDGQVLVSAYLDGPGVARFGESGLWIGSAQQPLASVARQTAPAPGFGAGVTYVWTTVPPLAGGRVIFWGVVQGVPPGGGEAALWAGNATSVDVVTRQYAAAPGAGDALYETFSPAINGSGQIAFSSQLVGPSKQYTGETGLWYGTAASQQLVLRSGDPAPQTAGNSIGGVSRPTINRAGQLGFVASVGAFAADDLGLFLDDLAIYTGTPGNLQLRARTGQPAPGMPAGVFFGGETIYGHGAQSFEQVQQGGQGQIAFRALVSGPGVDMSNNDGVWLGRPGQALKLIAREGDPAPGAPAGRTFSSDNADLDQYNPAFSQPSVNGRGQVVFGGAYSDGSGGLVPGIWGTDVDDTLRLIVYRGLAIDVGGGVVKILDRFDCALGSASEDGQNFVFNDAGQLVFDAHFTDGTSAVLIAEVPEPGVGVVVIFLVGLMSGRRGR